MELGESKHTQSRGSIRWVWRQVVTHTQLESVTNVRGSVIIPLRNSICDIAILIRHYYEDR